MGRAEEIDLPCGWTDQESMVPEIFVTTHDAARLLERFRDPFYAPLTNFLGDELRRATAVAPRAVPRDVVTMNARVRLSGGERATPRPLWCGLGGLLGRISVLTPVGSALIGMREGETNAWQGLNSRRRSVAILKVLYPPEANGLATPSLILANKVAYLPNCTIFRWL